MRRTTWFLLACVFFNSSPLVSADEGIPKRTLDHLKAATVYVKVEGSRGASSGSGFLIQVNGDIGFIVTNSHVVAAGRSKPEKISLVFWSGSKKERVVSAELVAADAERDLAVLKVVSPNLPAPLNLMEKVGLRETMTIYTFGFPLGDLLATSGANPAVTVGRGSVSSLREDGRGQVERVQLDGEVNPGNSGGPVVDADGKLVGIVVSKILGTKINFAIPPAKLTELLMGRAAPAIVRNLRVEDGSAQLRLEIPIIDPLNKLKMVELRHVRKDALKQLPQADMDGNWPDLRGSETMQVKIEGGKAVARITLKGAEKKPLDYLFQTAYAGGDGKLIATRPLAQQVDFGGDGEVPLDSPSRRPWETVTSAEGGFTVDMPTKPALNISRSRRVAGSIVKMLMIGCENEGGAYLAFRIDLPAAPPRGVEDRLLDAHRDSLAEEWNGKVLTEKKVLAQGNIGRDFAVRGKPDTIGDSMIRVRLYLIGRSIFVVAVLSPGGKELPEDAGRFLGSLAFGAAMTRATGTPEPEPKGKALKGWGKAFDPNGDCKFTPVDRGITIEVPGTLHDLFFDTRQLTAPRVLQEVEGDFVMSVKVVGEFKPGTRTTNPKTVPYLGAGILLWSDSDNNIRFERAAFRRGGIISSIAFQEREGGYSGAVHNERFNAGDCYLRLERKGSRIFGAVSINGNNWKQLKPIDTVWPSKLKVGLTAISTSDEPFVVKFQEFDLKCKGSGAEEKMP